MFKPLLSRAKRIVVVEASPGQLQDELRLALSKAGLDHPPIASVQRYGGKLPEQSEIEARVREAFRLMEGARTAEEVKA